MARFSFRRSAAEPPPRLVVTDPADAPRPPPRRAPAPHAERRQPN